MDLNKPVDIASADFAENKWDLLERLREERPVCQIRISIIKAWGVTRYDDCAAILKDPRIVRNRSTATGGGRLPFPVPASVKPLISSMIVTDDPAHRRQRDLVRHVFTPAAVAQFEPQLRSYAQQLLADLRNRPGFELQSEYALKIPTRMIADIMGVPERTMPEFAQGIRTLTEGFSGFKLVRSLFVGLPQLVKTMRGLIADKRRHPGDDMLTQLIAAEADGDRLSDDELLSLAFLLIVAGFETTVHLITNGVKTLLEHPQQLERLRHDPTLMDSAIEEILRHRGPVQGTKLGYATEDIELHGVTIPKGKPIMPLFGAANHDPRVFDAPQNFDIGRTPNRHLGFGHGIHYCLGAHLARLETRVALEELFAEMPDLALDANAGELKPLAMPGWHRFGQLPLRTANARAAA